MLSRRRGKIGTLGEVVKQAMDQGAVTTYYQYECPKCNKTFQITEQDHQITGYINCGCGTITLVIGNERKRGKLIKFNV